VVFDIANDTLVVRPVLASSSATSLTTSSGPAAGRQSPVRSPGLAGTSWQLVRFEGGDSTTLTPDDRTKHTIEFPPMDG
jgi:hypothetical protein